MVSLAPFAFVMVTNQDMSCKCTARVIAYLLESSLDPETSRRIDQAAASGCPTSQAYVREVQAFHQEVAETCRAVYQTDRPTCMPLQRLVPTLSTYFVPTVRALKTANEPCDLCLGAGTDVLLTYGARVWKIHTEHLPTLLAFWTVRHMSQTVMRHATEWKSQRPENVPGTSLQIWHVREIPASVVARVQWTYENAMDTLRRAYRLRPEQGQGQGQDGPRSSKTSKTDAPATTASPASSATATHATHSTTTAGNSPNSQNVRTASSSSPRSSGPCGTNPDSSSASC